MKHVGEKVAALLRPVPDFPKPGILFWDIAPVLRDPLLMLQIARVFAHYWKDQDIDVVAGFDARGFIFGPLVAHELGVGFEQIRKKGKLPGKTQVKSYDLEYGSAEVEMIDDGFIKGKRVLLLDDLLATGGTALAGAALVEKLEGIVAGFACVTDIPELGGRAKLWNIPVQSLVSIIGGKAEWDVEYCADILLTDESADTAYLIRRLSAPLGLAMPGGRIEKHESAIVAAIRETTEEVGCSAINFELMTTLTAPLRDPRGNKVSIVFSAEIPLTQLQLLTGEDEKTVVVPISWSELPPPEDFAFDHGQFVHEQV